ncbi:MAG TPA: heat-inducible transcription repressor HrcA [Gammaproteobacteria bacterium]|nr:heat-inducible transcription repressor HrcA [Gammaproteobacteria bacterium]
MTHSLNSRAEILLKALIEQYIDGGQPVGSRMLARSSGLKLSPATIRNVMSDLEELGLIHAPHTSAGRVPTQSGYRVFVDSLLSVKPVRSNLSNEFASSFSGESDLDHLVHSASTMLSEVTRFAGVVMVPHTDQVLFRHLEFLPLATNRLLVILVSQDGRVQNRVITTDREYTASELVEAANYFDETFAGLPLDRVRMMLLQGMEQDSAGMNQAIQDAIRMARQVFDDDEEDDRSLMVSGEEQLIEVPDLSNNETLRRLFGTFKAKQDLLDLLERSMGVDGIRIFIGEESGYDALADCSVVTAPFHREGDIVGTLGVIGPTRMHYDEVIPIVDITARLLSNALTN